MKEKHEELWGISTGKPCAKITDDNRKHVKLAIKELETWCDAFTEHMEAEKRNREMISGMAADKPISTITSFQAENGKVFKNEKEAKDFIMTRWFSYLLRYNMPMVHDGAKLRKERRKLLRDMESGKLVTANSAEALNRCLERIKDF